MILRGCGCVCSCRLPSGRQWASGLSMLLPAMRCFFSVGGPRLQRQAACDAGADVEEQTGSRREYAGGGGHERPGAGGAAGAADVVAHLLELAPPDVLPHAGEVRRARGGARHGALHVHAAVGGARAPPPRDAGATAPTAAPTRRAVRRRARRRGGSSSKPGESGIVVNFCPGPSVEAGYVQALRLRLAGSVWPLVSPPFPLRRPRVHRHDGGAHRHGLLLVERAPSPFTW